MCDPNRSLQQVDAAAGGADTSGSAEATHHKGSAVITVTQAVAKIWQTVSPAAACYSMSVVQQCDHHMIMSAECGFAFVPGFLNISPSFANYSMCCQKNIVVQRHQQLLLSKRRSNAMPCDQNNSSEMFPAFFSSHGVETLKFIIDIVLLGSHAQSHKYLWPLF